jgi:hypothetical protein
MTQHRTNALAPPPPSSEIAQSAAYRALPASTRALLLLIDIEIAQQGGLRATMTIDDLKAASGMHKPALIAAITDLSAAGFIVTTMIDQTCVVAPSSEWRT